MRHLLVITLFASVIHYSFGQPLVRDREAEKDSLHRELKIVRDDTSKIKIWIDLANYHKFNRADSGIYYATRAITLSRSISYVTGELGALQKLATSYRTLGDHAKVIRISMEGLKTAEQWGDTEQEAMACNLLGNVYYTFGNLQKSLEFHQRAYSLFKTDHNDSFVAIVGSNIARSFRVLNQWDSAFSYAYKAKELAESVNIDWVFSLPYSQLASIHRDLGNIDSALFYFKKSFANSLGSESGKSFRGVEIANLYMVKGQMDSSRYYAHAALQTAIDNKLYEDVVRANLFLTGFYENVDPLKALQYSKMAFAYADSLSNMLSMSSFEDFKDYDEQQRLFELESAEKEYQSRIRTNTLLGSTFTLAIIAFFLIRNNRQKHKAKLKVESAYDQLKSTQTQLVQSEKMASLGELTAGIAHEIQNPLNFVNNFSEVSEELVAELKGELEKGDLEEAKAISEDVKENLKKINHHGQRASGIVKGMLQHSRTSTGDKELTDINALADEYLRLAYHGLRAKDKSFNADFEADLDEALPKINVIPQDIGRVILNLINNAFQAVSSEALAKEASDYKPKVIVSTKLQGDSVEIKVSDNGPGIADGIKDKIFQPFFTTKAAGEGTGLGLSLSYDIITKGHDGELSFASEEGLGTKFIITLPVKSI